MRSSQEENGLERPRPEPHPGSWDGTACGGCGRVWMVEIQQDTALKGRLGRGTRSARR